MLRKPISLMRRRELLSMVYWRDDEVAEYLGVSKYTIRCWVKNIRNRAPFEFREGVDYVYMGPYRRWVVDETMGTPEWIHGERARMAAVS